MNMISDDIQLIQVNDYGEHLVSKRGVVVGFVKEKILHILSEVSHSGRVELINVVIKTGFANKTKIINKISLSYD